MRRAATIVCILGALLSGAPAAAAQTASPAPGATDASGVPQLQAAAAILVDAKTGRAIYAKDIHAQRAPASLTKVVTALVARDRFKLDEMVAVTDAVNPVRGERLGLEPGMQFTVRDLLYAMLLLSANDAATALAAHDPLGQAHFVELMNAKARALGAADSNFANPHGLDAPDHRSSAYDMALFARHLLADPVLAEIVATKTYPVPWPDGSSRVVTNHNKLLWRYEGAIGMKTGFTNKAGRCLIAVARTPAGVAITVVLGDYSHYPETIALFDYFKRRPPVPAGAPVLGAPVPQTARVAPKPFRAGPVGPVAGGSARYRWVVFPMGLLAVSMLLTLRRPRKRHPIADAAQFHHYLEPLASARDDPR